MVESIRFSIHRATPSDSLQIVDCLHAAFESYRDRYTSSAFLDTVLTPESVHQRLEEMTVFVATDEQHQVVGTIACKFVGNGEGHIRGMAVRAAWQGTGLAAQLLKTAESHLRELGCRRVSLDTTAPLLRAIRFYEREGFRSSGKVTDFFGMPLFEYVKRL